MVDHCGVALADGWGSEALDLEGLEVQDLGLVVAEDSVDVTGFLAFLGVESHHAGDCRVEEIAVLFAEGAEERVETGLVDLVGMPGVY